MKECKELDRILHYLFPWIEFVGNIIVEKRI